MGKKDRGKRAELNFYSRFIMLSNDSNSHKVINKILFPDQAYGL